MPDTFWTVIAQQHKELESARTADDVLRILSHARNPYGPNWDGAAGDGFFAGSGGDRTVAAALRTAGWTAVWAESPVYYTMRALDGSMITYIEGDIIRGDRRGNSPDQDSSD
ncbi:hypothetical protein OG413_41470 [Streptomyces sp. NBC_01433]|uniref:hypothetical protein n=1 Tax=Streptomyces sp. NBC_01433 TaxID=2903864 RepID=UPI002253714C|nr:hypothetical protein [Streptomyces sp. NBC_01433]MCX4681674.1 hypothetical protein [Streptomyces sp. NBC_01433]